MAQNDKDTAVRSILLGNHQRLFFLHQGAGGCLKQTLMIALQAFAAHNSGGKVIVQVERIVDVGSFPQRLIHVPGALVDKVEPQLKPQLTGGMKPKRLSMQAGSGIQRPSAILPAVVAWLAVYCVQHLIYFQVHLAGCTPLRDDKFGLRYPIAERQFLPIYCRSQCRGMLPAFRPPMIPTADKTMCTLSEYGTGLCAAIWKSGEAGPACNPMSLDNDGNCQEQLPQDPGLSMQQQTHWLQNAMV